MTKPLLTYVHSYGTRGSEMNYVIPEIKTQGKKKLLCPDSIKLIEVKENF